MTEAEKIKLIKQHVVLAKKFFLIPAHVRIHCHFGSIPEDMQSEGVAGLAECNPRYDFASVHFALDNMPDKEHCIQIAAHEVAHVAQMYADEPMRDMVHELKKPLRGLIGTAFEHSMELRTTLLTRLYLKHYEA